MTERRPCTEDLIVRARRGELSEGEDRSLQGALATSREAQLLLQAGLGFDAESALLPGDDRFVELLADRVAYGHPVKSRRLWRVALVAALCSFLASSAAAGAWIALQQWLRSAPDARPVLAAPASASGVREAAFSPRAAAPAAPHPSAQSSAAGPEAPAPSVAFPTDGDAAASLFEAANRARREGRTAEAIALYERLQERYPRAAEARHASLTLGQLYLSHGDASAALRSFRLYRGRAMAAEALWGEARALRQLHRTAEERQTLRTLAETVPASPYAEAARKRLQAIDEAPIGR